MYLARINPEAAKLHLFLSPVKYLWRRRLLAWLPLSLRGFYNGN